MLGFSEPYGSGDFSSIGSLESAVLDSAALGSGFFSGVGCVVLPGFKAAGLAFSGGSSSNDSLGAKHGKQASKPPDLGFLLLVEPSRGWVAGTGGGGSAFSETAGRF